MSLTRASKAWPAVLVCGLVLSAGSAACASRESPRFDVLVHVESDPGRPVARAQLAHDGRVLASSDAQGRARLRVSGAAGDSIPLQVTCPTGYRSPEASLAVLLRPLLDPRRIPEYRVRCPPSLRSVLVAVRAQNGPGLPLKYLGEEISRTNASGACHALLKLVPGETATLTLDTRAHAKLMPQNPELKLTVPERDEVVIFDQAFTRAPDEPKRRAKRRRGPVRL